MINRQRKRCIENSNYEVEGKLLRKRLSIALAVVICFAAGCERKKTVETAVEPRVVKVEQAARRELALTITTSGTTAPIQHSRLNFEVPGVVSKVMVKMGDRVRKDQPLAKLGDTDYFLRIAQARAGLTAAKAALRKLKTGFRPQEIAQAQAGVEAAESGLEQARTNFRRMKQLFEQKKLVSEASYEQAKTAYEVARAKREQAAKQLALVRAGFRQEDIDTADAQVLAAQTVLRMAQEALRDTTLDAPYDGVIVSVNVDPGDKVPRMPGRAEVEIMDISKFELVVSVPDTYAMALSRGAQAVVDLDGGPSGLEARLSGISGAIERVSRALPVRIVLENPDLKLKAGMFARVRITYRIARGLAVRSAAVLEDTNGKYVLVYEAGRAKRSPVQTGITSDGYTLIKPMSFVTSATAAVSIETIPQPATVPIQPVKGTTEGQPVIVEGNFGLRHGAPVVLASKARQPGGSSR